LADQLCTPTQVKNRLQNAQAGVTFSATDTTTITELIEEVSDWMQHFTGRRFVPITSTTYIVDTEAGYVLRFPIGVRTVSALTINTLTHQPDTGGTYPTTIAAANILLRPSGPDLPVGWPPTQIRLSRAQSTVAESRRPFTGAATFVGAFVPVGDGVESAFGAFTESAAGAFTESTTESRGADEEAGVTIGCNDCVSRATSAGITVVPPFALR